MTDLGISFTGDHVRAVRQAELRRRALLGAGAVAEDIYLDPEMQAASEAIKRAQMEKAKKAKDRGNVRRMKIHDADNGVWAPIRVKLDSGAENRKANFLTGEMVERFNLGPLTVHGEAVSFVLINKSTVDCKKSLNIEWLGNDGKTRTTEFFVLPKGSFPLEMPYLSQNFIEDYGDYLFGDEEEEGPLAFVAQGKKTETEMRQMEQNRRAVEQEEMALEQRREEKRLKEKRRKQVAGVKEEKNDRRGSGKSHKTGRN